MDVSLFDYNLPEEAIAQHPIEPRDNAKLLVLNKKTGQTEHCIFFEIGRYLQTGDVLVLNRTRVMPARLLGVKEDSQVEVEFVLLTPREDNCWEALVRPGRRLKPGAIVSFGGGLLKAEILDYTDFSGRLVRFNYQGDFHKILEQVGQMPLPPYIHRSPELEDRERYQTVFSQEAGSAAAPTAGLHFTRDLLEQLQAKGVKIVTLLLHVGLGTFRPVQVEQVEDHKMHSEFFSIEQEAAEIINQAKKEGRRVIAVGTTSIRTLESTAVETGIVKPQQGWTDIFIYPGYSFKIADGLITNFHLPRSTLLMLISALADREKILKAYDEAVHSGYRFFSYGDAMLII